MTVRFKDWRTFIGMSFLERAPLGSPQRIARRKGGRGIARAGFVSAALVVLHVSPLVDRHRSCSRVPHECPEVHTGTRSSGE